MTEAQVNEVISKLKEDGHSEEEILGSFYKMFQDYKINFDQLEALTEALGWHITDDFRAMSDEDRKTKGYEEVEDESQEGVDKETVEDAKEVEEEDEAMSLFGIKGK